LNGAHGPEGPEGKLVPSSPIDYFRINTEVTNVAYPSWPTSPFWGDRPARGRHQHRFGFASDTARARPLRAAAASKTLLYLLVATNGLHKISNTLSFEASICLLSFFPSRVPRSPNNLSTFITRQEQFTNLGSLFCMIVDIPRRLIRL
jgi:hypothetical protein